MEALPLNVPFADLNPQPLPRDLEKACRSLEEAFVTIVFRKMHEAMVPKTSKGSSGFARETTQGMLDAQWAHLSSEGEGLGLWRALYRQLEPSAIKSAGRKDDETGLEKTTPQRLERGRSRLYGGQPRSARTNGPGHILAGTSGEPGP